jgi:hypothetical protein
MFISFGSDPWEFSLDELLPSKLIYLDLNSSDAHILVHFYMKHPLHNLVLKLEIFFKF